MCTTATSAYCSPLIYLDDESVALTLQLEEINDRGTSAKGKYPINQIPDLELAYTSYLAEVESRLSFIKDIKLAHSIANAVTTDASAIADITSAEVQAQDDRRTALHMNSNDPEFEAPTPYNDEVARRLELLLSSEDASDEDNENNDGPSVPYTQLQAEVLGKLSREDFECSSCTNNFRWAEIRKLECQHQYCAGCLKRVIMRATLEKNLVYLPPRCCGTAIPDNIILDNLTQEEREDFRNTEEEKLSSDKTYCTNPDCGTFIASRYITAGEAICPRCNAKTCAPCKNRAHGSDCPADSELQATLDLGKTQHWQRCFSCRALVEIDTGCNHVVCRCGAEFCYLCGTQWHNCRCAFWLEPNLFRRSEQDVEMQEGLRDNDECE